jgi:hypothetical protein
LRLLYRELGLRLEKGQSKVKRPEIATSKGSSFHYAETWHGLQETLNSIASNPLGPLARSMQPIIGAGKHNEKEE